MGKKPETDAPVTEEVKDETATVAEQVEQPVETIDTKADEPEGAVAEQFEVLAPRKTLSQLIRDEAKAAQAAGNATLHADLHNFDIALGDFKRAALRVEGSVDPASHLGDFLSALRTDI